MQNAIYNAYFGFSENPFNISPDPEFLYRSPQHEEALANLTYGVRSRRGFIVLTGEVGTGKTTMLECLRDILDAQRTEFAFIFNSRLTPEQFFEMMAYDFDLKCDRKSKTDVLFALNTLLIEQANRNRTCVLIVDEAHNCAPSGRGKYATDSLRTGAIRLLAPHFEHKLFLTATPHNG
ncbi:MAG: AAA family ATPase, partial [Acidobacteriota bacterium]|nr:AAA family ATPase [Acidobacteriota bacterium]